ncbi:MAG: hypothetical protein ACYDD2_00445 [Candidatus Acidiferrales bacterium]
MSAAGPLGVIPRSSAEDEPKQVLLVQKVAQKTKEGKIKWAKTKTTLTASIAGGLVFNFVLSYDALLAVVGGGMDWQLFTVKKENGEELVKVENISGVQLILSGAYASPLQQAAKELFRTIRNAGNPEIDDAIAKIERL